MILALGSIKQRRTILDLLSGLHMFPMLTHDEALTLIDGRQLWGRGLSAVDVHLLGSVALLSRADRRTSRSTRARSANASRH